MCVPYRKSYVVLSGTAVAVQHDGAVFVISRQIVTPSVVVDNQRHVVDWRQSVTELDRRQHSTYHVTEPHNELDVLVTKDRGRRRGEQQVTDDVVELSTTGRRVGVTGCH